MELRGKLIGIYDPERVSDKMTRREFVVETEGKYPKKVCFQLINDRTDLIDPYQTNETIIVHYDLQSREYNGKWYTSATAFRIEKQGYNQPNNNNEGDLPF